VVVSFSSLDPLTELLQLDSELLTTLREKVTLRELSRISFMTPVEEPHLQKLSSEIHTDTSKELSTSSLSKECTLDSLFTPEPRLHSLLVIFSQSNLCQKELLSPTARVRWEIEDPSLELPEPQLSLLVTPMMVRRLELDFHPVPERPFLEAAELWLELLLEVKEPISLS